MSISVQSTGGPQWPKRDWAGVRASAERVEAERDEPTAVDRKAAANPQDYATDAVRLAALRRNAAATAAASTPKAQTAADDTEIATRTWDGDAWPDGETVTPSRHPIATARAGPNI